MVVLTGREKPDVIVGWMLQPTAEIVVGERERENWRGVGESEIQPDDHWNQPYKSYYSFISNLIQAILALTCS
jgi:hypothetical protein